MSLEAEEFFQQYEKAIAAGETPAIGRLYASTFMFGGTNGVQTVTREDFLKVIPRRKTYFASLGLSDTQLGHVQAAPIAPRYLIANVTWGMTVQSASGEKHIAPSATYILMREPDHTLSIIVQIDHQDLSSILNDQPA